MLSLAKEVAQPNHELLKTWKVANNFEQPLSCYLVVLISLFIDPQNFGHHDILILVITVVLLLLLYIFCYCYRNHYDFHYYYYYYYYYYLFIYIIIVIIVNVIIIIILLRLGGVFFAS